MTRPMRSLPPLAVAALLTLPSLPAAPGSTASPGPGVAHAADLDRAAVDFQTPAEIKWVRNAAGTNEQAILFGDPSKPGDRFFAVLSDTWWIGTGETFDPERTVPAPAGSYVIHYGGKVHYDGAKGEETIIQVWGMGPATSTPAEKR